MRNFGLIGYPLEHSFSPAYFSEKFRKEGIADAVYRAYPIRDPSQIFDIIDDTFVGLNVTIPYKESIIPYLDDLDDSALSIMAVNTIRIEGGKLKGFNTDIFGFKKSLDRFLGNVKPDRALILGTGGAAKAVAYVLGLLNWDYCFISRRKAELRYEDLDEKLVSEFTLIVNTTPVGMYPQIGEMPRVPMSGISEGHFVIDLIYNPEKTVFLRTAEANGAAIMNGMEMLINQAEKSWEIWNQ